MEIYVPGAGEGEEHQVKGHQQEQQNAQADEDERNHVAVRTGGHTACSQTGPSYGINVIKGCAAAGV